MKNKNSAVKTVGYPAFLVCVICALFGFLLMITNAATADQIAGAQKSFAEETRLVVLPQAESFEDKVEYFVGISDGKEIGYVFQTASRGYGGEVVVLTGISVDGKVTGVSVISHNETPGLGANAEKKEFTDSFLKDVPENGFSVTKNANPTDEQISAITGATITTNAVNEAVNEAISLYNSIKGGE